MEKLGAESGGIRSSLESLEAELRARAPAIARSLHPGLSAAAIGRVASVLDFTPPDDVHELFRWHDGTGSLKGGTTAELFPGGRPLSLAEAVGALADARRGNELDETYSWKAGWLPIFTDDMGSWFAVDCMSPAHPVVSIHYVDLPATHAGYRDLRHMVVTLTKLWISGAYWQNESGQVDENPRAVAAVRRSEDLERPNLPHLIAALDGPSVDSYLLAIDTMRTRLYPETVGGFIDLLQTGTSRGRRAAAELLGSIGDPIATRILENATESDPDEAVRADARKALRQLKGSG